MTWSEKSLDELGFVGRGKSRHRPRDAEHLYGGSYPFIQTSDVKHANLYITEHSQTYSEAGLAQSKLWQGGTLCITIAANIADTAILAFDACFPDSVIGFVADDNKADTRFVKYLFDAHLKTRYKKFTQGAAQDNLSQAKLLSLKFPAPDVSVQRRIADTIAVYDNLIENNCRRIELLEQAARSLYTEWFIHFRFPGHEHLKIADGVPEGWTKVNVEGLLLTHIGGGWGQDEPTGNETEPAYVIRGTDIAHVVEGQFDSIGLRFHKETGLKNRLLKNGDIIFEVSGGSVTQPVGRVLRINELISSQFEYGVIPASFCKLLRPESAAVSSYFYHHLKHIRESGELQVYQKQSASALQNFNFSAFMNHHLVSLPTQDLLRDFSEQVTLLEHQMANLAQQNTRLIRSRDLLLPRLMNGEIAI